MGYRGLVTWTVRKRELEFVGNLLWDAIVVGTTGTDSLLSRSFENSKKILGGSQVWAREFGGARGLYFCFSVKSGGPSSGAGLLLFR